MHAYERSHPVYNYTVDPCGPVHITIGDGGNSEGVSFLGPDKKRERERPLCFLYPGTLLLGFLHKRAPGSTCKCTACQAREPAPGLFLSYGSNRSRRAVLGDVATPRGPVWNTSAVSSS